jgi:biotin carboxyl carrier protein
MGSADWATADPGGARAVAEWFDLGIPDFEHGRGEVMSIMERIVVSPANGRLSTEPLWEGEPVEAGAVIALVRENGHQMPVIATVSGAFVSWIAVDGQRIAKGNPVCRLRTVKT